jgi:hypothetical protein
MTLQTQANAVSDGIHKSVETNGFYQTPNSMAIKAIRGKLTAADWALWSYLQMIDPFGDKMIELPKIPEIAEAIGISSRQIKRSLSRLEELELYIWEPILVRGQNLAGKKAKELCQQKRINKSSEKSKMTDLSDSGQSCPNDDRIVQTVTDLSKNGQNCPNREPEPLPSNGFKFPQTYSDFIQTLSEGERENFWEFSKKKTASLPKPPQLPMKWIEANFEELRGQWLETQNPKGKYNFEAFSEPQHQMWFGQLQVVVKSATERTDDTNLRQFLNDDFYECWFNWAKSARVDVRELLAKNPILEKNYG